MRAFVALRIMMEYLCYKPRYEAYWYGRNKNVVTQTPGFGDVMNRDRFLAIWTYWKIVDEEDPNLDKNRQNIQRTTGAEPPATISTFL